MATPEQVYNELIQILQITIMQNPSVTFIQMIEGDVNGLEESLYHYYSDPKGAYVIKNLIEQHNAEKEIFKEQLKNAQQTVKSFAARYPRFIQIQTDFSWVYITLDPERRTSTKYRLYLNIQVSKFNEFVIRFLNMIFSGDWNTGYYLSCWDCENGVVKYDSAQQKLMCGACANNDFYFKFKFGQPGTGLRYDKIVMYLPSQEKAISIAKNMNKLRSFFDPKTMYFTAQYFPGLGIAVEPEKEESKEISEEKISFGELILNTLSKIVIRVVNSNKSKAMAIYQAWLRNNKRGAEQMKNANQLFDALNREIFPQMRALIAVDPVLLRYFEKLERKVA